MKLGFTGTQLGMSPLQFERVEQEVFGFMPDEADHGMCVGSDTQFHGIVRSLFSPRECKIVGHPPTKQGNAVMDLDCDELMPVGDYIVRDKAIVNRTERMIATPYCPEIIRSGTWTTVRYARKLGRPVTIVWPDGSITKERY